MVVYMCVMEPSWHTKLPLTRSRLGVLWHVQVLDRYFDELSECAATLPSSRSAFRHPTEVLQQLYGLAHLSPSHEAHSLSSRIVPKELLRNDAEEACGVSFWLLNLLGATPLPGEHLAQCYEVRLGPIYVSLAQDMCRLALYSNYSLTALIEELGAAGASCSPPMSSVMASLAEHGPALDQALYASVPPALELRVALNTLLEACPTTHPDAQHLRSAMQHIDSSFAIAPLAPVGSGTWRSASMLGRLGVFFSELETRFDSAKRTSILRGPVGKAHQDLLAEATDAIQSFRAHLSRELVETSVSVFDHPALGPVDTHMVMHQAHTEAHELGWQIVPAVLDTSGTSHLVAVERSVNAVVLTRLWPTLDDLLSGVEREKDARIALGLPAFGWDQKGLVKLVQHLDIPACLLPPKVEILSPSSHAVLDVALPLFYSSAAERLRDMARAKTPEDKALAIAAAARAILVCLEKHVVRMHHDSATRHADDDAPANVAQDPHASVHAQDDGANGLILQLSQGAVIVPDPVRYGGRSIDGIDSVDCMSMATLLQRCLAFTVLRMAHEKRASTFRR